MIFPIFPPWLANFPVLFFLAHVVIVGVWIFMVASGWLWMEVFFGSSYFPRTLLQSVFGCTNFSSSALSNVIDYVYDWGRFWGFSLGMSSLYVCLLRMYVSWNSSYKVLAIFLFVLCSCYVWYNWSHLIFIYAHRMVCFRCLWILHLWTCAYIAGVDSDTTGLSSHAIPLRPLKFGVWFFFFTFHPWPLGQPVSLVWYVFPLFYLFIFLTLDIWCLASSFFFSFSPSGLASRFTLCPNKVWSPLFIFHYPSTG